MKKLNTLSALTTLVLTGLLTLHTPAQADADMTFHGTLIDPPPCVINGDQPITVEFGDVMTTRVDGANYRMPVEYTLSCEGAVSNAMKLTITGTPMTGIPAALQTNKTGLGVKLQQGSNDLTINSPINFTYPAQPELFAVPVKQSGATLTEGAFTTTATMSVAYQ